MAFFSQEYWSGLPFPSPGDLPNPRIEPRSPTFRADALTSEPPGKLTKRSPLKYNYYFDLCHIADCVPRGLHTFMLLLD